MARSRTAVASVLALVACLTAAGCDETGEGRDPYRIGVVTDCAGILRAFGTAELAGAQLPLIERGARPRGDVPQAGVTRATVGGREVELVPGCTEVLEFSTLTQEVRRLVENEHVDALVAGSLGPDEIVLRELARRYPAVTVIPAAPGPREVTLAGSPRNLYRVSADESQGAAGLGTYARRELGWRRAAVVYVDWDAGWGARDVFVREFCALGGRVTRQVPMLAFDPKADLARVPRDVDGVVVLSGRPFDPSTFLRALGDRLGDPRRMLLGPGIIAEREWLAATGPVLDGVVGGATPPGGAAAGRRAYRRSYARAFPRLPATTADSPFAIAYRNAIEALVLGLEEARGDETRLPAALAGLDADLTGVPTRLDDNRQATVRVALVRVAGDPSGPGGPRLQFVRSIPEVDQSVGGLIADDAVPDARRASCARGPAPPWAR